MLCRASLWIACVCPPPVAEWVIAFGKVSGGLSIWSLCLHVRFWSMADYIAVVGPRLIVSRALCGLTVLTKECHVSEAYVRIANDYHSLYRYDLIEIRTIGWSLRVGYGASNTAVNECYHLLMPALRSMGAAAHCE